MAAATTSSTVTATPFFDTSNLARGLFTDLGLLLALFGDEATKQFLTVSLGLGDDLLLTIVLIGIMTIIVSAIRVGGYPWMKSFIGRHVAFISLMTLHSSLTSETEQGTPQMTKKRSFCRRLQAAFEKFGTDIALFASLKNHRRLS